MSISYDPETLGAYFQPVSKAVWDDPIKGPLLHHLAKTDPDVLAAVADVDRSQISDALALSPEQRVAQACAVALAFRDYRRAPT
jgi:hypothetical protein